MANEIDIKRCICCWYDLLGYGEPFINSKWNLHDPLCKINMHRIEALKHWFYGLLSMNYKVTKLCFNDGAISNIDVDIKNDESLYSAIFFLETIIRDYMAVNDVDKRMGFPGVRGVLTCGDRFDYDHANDHFDVVQKRTIAYHPREFQMNTAFSKAFIIEESGSKAGIKGANLYIDKELFLLIDNAFKNSKKHSIDVQEVDNTLKIIVNFDNEWFANVFVDKEAIIYKYKGIETKLYRLVEIESEIQERAKEQARQQALRYALMESYVE